jgi:hypothetical protein
VDEELKRLAAAEQAAIEELYRSLGQLCEDPTFILLQRASLAGVTKKSWEIASAAIVSAMSRLGTSRDTVRQAVRLLHADPPDLKEANRLLRGRCVEVHPAQAPPEEHRPPASGSSLPRFTLHVVEDLAADDLQRARRVVADVAAVLEVARPRLEALTAQFTEVNARLSRDTANGTKAELAGLRHDLDAAEELLATDPLAVRPAGGRAPHGRGRLDLSQLDAIRDRLTRLASDGGADQVVQRADEALEERDLLRGRLEVFRLRAVSAGHVRPELTALYKRAHQLLEADPCDLGLAGEAVQKYISMERGQ